MVSSVARCWASPALPPLPKKRILPPPWMVESQALRIAAKGAANPPRTACATARCSASSESKRSPAIAPFPVAVALWTRCPDPRRAAPWATLPSDPSGGKRRRANCLAFKPFSEALDPGAKLHLPGPGAARLAMDMEIGIGDGVRIESRLAVRILPDAAIDDEMGDMDVLGRQLARHALCQPPQRELAHREGRRLGVALHAGRSAGEEDAAMALLQHAPGGGLRHEEAAIGGDHDRLLDLHRIQLDEGAPGAPARIVDDQIDPAQFLVDRVEQGRDILAPAGIA